MTTPRVTVPVEPTEAMIDAAEKAADDKPTNGWGNMIDITPAETWAAMIAAAPAPEGGAVHYGDPCTKCGVGHDNVPPGPCRGDGITVSRERATAILDYLKKGSGPAGWPTTLWCEVQAFIANIEAALATREEAPAEAGERDGAFCEAYYEEHLNEAWAALREGRPYQVNADGAICLIQQAASDRRTLRAQPPVREDAQPLGCFCDEADCPSCSSINPAPDALRIAVEALDEMADTDPDDGTAWFHDRIERARQALAALQAEQKGGAA